MGSSWRSRVDGAAAAGSPSYFALVMATGIVSVGAHLLDVEAVAIALYAFNIAAYIGLWALTIVRIVSHRAALVRDLTDHRVAFGFFTIVAGTCVLGIETILIADHVAIAAVRSRSRRCCGRPHLHGLHRDHDSPASRRCRRGSTVAGCCWWLRPRRSPS